MAGMTRQEFIDNYGYDPELYVAPEDSEMGTVGKHLRAAGAGILSIPTDLAAAPGVVGAATSALAKSYWNDTSFGDEFAKNVFQPDYKERIDEHLTGVRDAWRQQNPNVSDDILDKSVQQYQKSKKFEDFRNSLLTGSTWLGMAGKNWARSTLGDERPAHERGWTESAAEAVGGALIPGPPAGTIAGMLGRVGQNAAVRGTLRGLELALPTTTPYTPANVAANAAVSVGVDQAMRHLQGESTPFNPNPDEPGVGTLAAAAGAGAGLLAVVGVVRGRSNAALLARQRTSQVESELANAPTLEPRVANPMVPGEASIIGGVEQQLRPPSYLDATGITGMQRRALSSFVDESIATQRTLADIGQDVNYVNARIMSNVGPAARDRIRADVDTIMRELDDLIRQMPPERARAFEESMQMSTYAARLDIIDQKMTDQLADLQNNITRLRNSTNPNAPAQLAKAQADFAALQQQLNDFRADVGPRMRPMMPDIPLAEVRRQDVAVRTDLDPQITAGRNFVQKWGGMMRDLFVRSGKLSQPDATAWGVRDPNYSPIMRDPYQGTTGLARVIESISEDLLRRGESSVGMSPGSQMLRTAPIHEFKKDIPSITSGAESRVTRPLELQTAIRKYTEMALRDAYETHARNELVEMFLFDSAGNKTWFHNKGFVRILEIEGKTWFNGKTAGKNDALIAAIRDPYTVAQWQGGNVRLVQFGDLPIAAMLRQDPVVFGKMVQGLNVTGKWFKFFTTGKGNPAFAIKGAMYDILINMLTHLPSRAIGPVSWAMQRVLPAGMAKVLSVVPDISALPGLGYFIPRSFFDTLAFHTSRAVVNALSSENSALSALVKTLGPNLSQKMLQKAMNIATWAQDTTTMKLMHSGAAHGIGAVDDIAKVRGAYDIGVIDRVPRGARAAWQFYGDLINAVYLGQKNQYYTLNHALLNAKHGGQIPQEELIKLLNETRTIGGDMSKIPGSKIMREAQAAAPYLSQSILGLHHLVLNTTSRDRALYVIPRLAMFTMAAGSGIYARTYWDKDSYDELWKRTPEYERYRTFFIPKPPLMTAWATGENLAHKRDLYWLLPLPPDVAGIVAGTVAFGQMAGMIPSSTTPKPAIRDVPRVFLDSLTPAMPPALQALLATGGIKLDPQGADTRGGSIFRTFGSQFRSGPQAESASNLGEVSNSTALLLNSIFGVMGGHIAAAGDVMLHAAKYQVHPTNSSVMIPRNSINIGAGIREGAEELLSRTAARVPDIPMVWQNKDKYKISTPAWTAVAEQNQYVRSIVGMRDQLRGKTAQQRRAQATAAGGIAEPTLQDPALAQLADEIAAWQRPTGDLGRLKKQYKDLSAARSGVEANYNLSTEQKRERVNAFIKKMQDNMHQQMLSIKYVEQLATAKYGQLFADKLQGRPMTMQVIDQLMRENVGQPRGVPQPTAEQQ